MAVYNKFNQFTKDLIDGKHNFSSNTFKVFLTNTQPLSNMTVKTDMTEVSNLTTGVANGYTPGGPTVTVTATTAGGVAKVTGANAAVTAAATAGIQVGPFQFAVLYNDSATGDPVISWWDYGTAITLAPSEVLTVVFDATNGIITVI
jgi:PKD repeat protein